MDLLVQCNQYRVSLYPAGLFLPYTIFFFFKQANKNQSLKPKMKYIPPFFFYKVKIYFDPHYVYK